MSRPLVFGTGLTFPDEPSMHCTCCSQIYIGECVLANELLAKTKVW